MPTPGVPLSTLLYSASRVAGITQTPGRGPSVEQTEDFFGIFQRMIGGWNCGSLKIFTTSIASYPLTVNQKAYTIGGPGLGADFDAPRPQSISGANLIMSFTDPIVRRPLKVLTDQEWRAISVQDIQNSFPTKLYPDGNYPLCTLYLCGQPVSACELELYTWQQLPTFTDSTNLVALPPGYEEAIVYNLAERIASQFPGISNISPLSIDLARKSLGNLAALNTPRLLMRCESAITGDRGRFNIFNGRFGA